MTNFLQFVSSIRAGRARANTTLGSTPVTSETASPEAVGQPDQPRDETSNTIGQQLQSTSEEHENAPGNTSNSTTKTSYFREVENALKSVLPVTAKPPNWFRWRISSVHGHPDAMLFGSERVPSKWMVFFDVYVRSDVDVFELLQEGIPWEQYLSTAKETTYTATYKKIQVVDLPPATPPSGKKSDGIAWTRRFELDGPEKSNKIPRWSLSVRVVGGKKWISEVDPTVLLAKETAIGVRMYDNFVRLHGGDRLGLRRFEYCPQLGNFWADDRIFDEVTAHETARNLMERVIRRNLTSTFGKMQLNLFGKYQYCRYSCVIHGNTADLPDSDE